MRFYVSGILLAAELVRPAIIETTALGAAYLAVGFWKDMGEISTLWKVDKVFEPKMTRERASDLRGRWNEALIRSKGWEPKEKSELKVTESK